MVQNLTKCLIMLCVCAEWGWKFVCLSLSSILTLQHYLRSDPHKWRRCALTSPPDSYTGSWCFLDSVGPVEAWCPLSCLRCSLSSSEDDEKTEERTKSWSWGGQSWVEQSRGGSTEEVKSVKQSHDTLSLPLFSQFVFRLIILFFLPTHTLCCESVSAHDHMLSQWEEPGPLSESWHTL